MRTMLWAKRWKAREVWDHRLRVMLGFDEQKVRWHRRNVHLGTLARMWKSYIAKDAYEREESHRRESLRASRMSSSTPVTEPPRYSATDERATQYPEAVSGSGSGSTNSTPTSNKTLAAV